MDPNIPGEIPSPSFDALKQILGEEKVPNESLISLLAARAFLNLALAALANPRLEEVFPKRVTDWIIVSPIITGALDFYVDTLSGGGGPIHVTVTPGDFDMTDWMGRQEFKAYRALVDFARKLPVSSREPDGLASFGALSFYCEEEDLPKWAEVWKHWEHTHES